MEDYRPPYDLTSDMLFAAALCPTGPMRRAFPGVPFLSIWGRTPLGMWFSRVKRACYWTAAGEPDCLGSLGADLYHELTIVALLRRRAVFVPDIRATSELTIKIGDLYGMPKWPTVMSFEMSGDCVESSTSAAGRESYVRALTLGPGRWLARLAGRYLPAKTWPARFPGGDSVRALLLTAARLQPARVESGQLWLDVDWLPRPLPLLPVGLFAGDLRMELPPP